jgi:group I intron endonuclease
MFYLVYKITNLINGKFYVGAHKTINKNDGYMGSGVLITRAIEKYGIENFIKEILFECSSLDEMYKKEAECVILDISKSYNMIPGGWGGFTLETSLKGVKAATAKRIELLRENPEFAKWVSERLKEGLKKRVENGLHKTFTGKKHTQEAKEKIGAANSEYQKGNGNSQYGTMWIHNPTTFKNAKIKINMPIPTGWVKGRKIKNI